MTTKAIHFLDLESLLTWLPIFEEGANDIPPGYGIEHSADGGFYPYEIDISDPSRIGHLRDSNGLDVRYTSREAALSAIVAEVGK